MRVGSPLIWPRSRRAHHQNDCGHGGLATKLTVVLVGSPEILTAVTAGLPVFYIGSRRSYGLPVTLIYAKLNYLLYSMWFVSRWHILQVAYFQNSLALLFSNCSAQFRAVPRRFAQFRADSRSSAHSRRFAQFRAVSRSSAHSRRIVIARIEGEALIIRRLQTGWTLLCRHTDMQTHYFADMQTCRHPLLCRQAEMQTLKSVRNIFEKSF